MAELFKCGSIANIINEDSNNKKIKKKKTKLSKIFDQVIEENKDKVIQIAKVIEKNDENETNSENEMLINQNESDSEGDSNLKSTNKSKNKIKKRSDSPEKTKRTLFVGNLPTSITAKVSIHFC